MAAATHVVSLDVVVHDVATAVACSVALANVELVVAVAATSQPRRFK